MELIDNVNKTLADDLKQTIKPNSKISIAASCFSIYAYQDFLLYAMPAICIWNLLKNMVLTAQIQCPIMPQMRD